MGYYNEYIRYILDTYKHKLNDIVKNKNIK